MSKNTALLYLALLSAYFGDYCTLIALFEYAKLFGASERVVLLSIVYSIPPVFFFFFADRWGRSQRRPARQLGCLLLGGALVVSTLFLPMTLAQLIVVSFLLGALKQGGLILLNTFIKRSFSEEAPKVLGNTVSLRFFIMVFGGALGAYLGGLGLFHTVFAINAGCFLFAGVIFLCLSESPAPSSSPHAAVKVPLLSSGHTFTEMARAFGPIPLLWTFAGLAHIGLFMALEYPFLTTELAVPTHLIGVVWTGHIIGTVLAQMLTQRVIAQRLAVNSYLSRKIILYAALQIGVFGTMGYFGKGLWMVTLHMAVAVFFMVASEVFAGVHLLNVSNQENFPRFNLIYRSSDLLLQLVSSLIPLFIFGAIQLQQINLVAALGLLGVSFLGTFLFRRSASHAALAVVALLALAGCTGGSSSKHRDHLALHSEILGTVDASLKKTIQHVEEAAKLLASDFATRKHCAPYTKKTDGDLSTSYFPKSVHKGNRLNCLVESSRILNPIWKQAYEKSDFMSWLYLYDSETRYMRIYPSTNVRTLFGEDLNFDSFLFYSLAVAKYPDGAWVPIKFDVNGTGRIFIYSQAVKLGNSSRLSTISVDMRPTQLFKEQQDKLSEYAAAKRSPHVFMYAYQIHGGSRTQAYDFSTQSSKWRILRSFNGTSLQISPPEQKILNELENKANSKELVKSELSIEGTPHFCSAGVLDNVDIAVIFCEEL